MSSVVICSEPLALSPEGAAEYLSLSKPSIYRLLSAGAFKAKRLGSRTLIDGKSIRSYYANLPDFVPGASIPNASQAKPTAGKRRRRAA